MLDPGPWTWLEVAKLTASLLVPLTLAGIGIYVHRVTKRFEAVQWRGQKLIEKRLAVYDDLAPLLNDLLCYFTYVGGWRDMNPPDIVALKRKLDKKIHLAAPLFTASFYGACSHFQDQCFETYSGLGSDAKLRTQHQNRRAFRSDWKDEWDTLFSSSQIETREIREAYYAVMTVMARDIGVHDAFVIPPSGLPPKISDR